MATLSLTVVPGKALKDGKHKVRIAVAHNSQTRYILTDVILNSTKEWKNGKVVKRGDSTYLNSKLLARLDEVQHIIDETPYIEGLSCAELVTCILHARAKKTHTLRSAFEEMLEVSSAKETTKERYRTQFKSIISVIPEDTFVTHLSPLGTCTHHPADADNPALADRQVLPGERLHRVSCLADARILPAHRCRPAELAHPRPGALHQRHRHGQTRLQQVP